MRKVIIKKGKHHGYPKRMRIRRKVVTYRNRIILDESAIYQHHESGLMKGDQHDFNKARGVSFNLLSNHFDTVLPAWRWNTEKEVFEWIAYFHMDRNTYLGRNRSQINGWTELHKTELDILFTSLPGQMVWYSVGPEEKGSKRVGIKFELGKQVYTDYLDFAGPLPGGQDRKNKFRPCWHRTTGHYFGGNRPAPHQITILE